VASIPGFVLLEQARDGSPTAISALFERYGGKLHALIRARLGPQLRRRVESRDIVQIAMMRAFEGFQRFDGAGSRSFVGWLAAIAQAEICDRADYYGRQKRDLGREKSLRSGFDAIARQVHTEVSRLQLESDLERLAEAVDTLSEDQREVVLLRSFEELPFRAIGERMGRSADACRMLYARALANLASRM